MGSLNTDGSPKLQPNVTCAIRHHGDFLVKSTTDDDQRVTDIASSGVIRTNFDSRGVAWQAGGTPSTAGLSLTERTADDSVEREKFTHDLTASGNLQQHVTRAMGIHTSISDRQAISDPVLAATTGLAGADATGPMQTISERKVFFLDETREDTPPVAGWKIFNQAGDAVGPTDGTTETDSTPNEGLLGK
jgi:hypothetical protein